jgi:hypothetical protein
MQTTTWIEEGLRNIGTKLQSTFTFSSLSNHMIEHAYPTLIMDSRFRMK